MLAFAVFACFINSSASFASATPLRDNNQTFSFVEPDVSQAERGLVGSINELRALNGLYPLQISSTLSASADAYAHYLNASWDGIDDPHAQMSSQPNQRAGEFGYPLTTLVTESYAVSDTPYGIVSSWRAVSTDNANMISRNYELVGIGHVGDVWIASFGAACNTGACGLTGDYGDPTLIAGAANGPWLKPKIKVTFLKAAMTGSKIKIRVSISSGEGIVRASLRSGKNHASVRVTRNENEYVFSASPRTARTWKLTIRFSGRGSWQDSVISQKIVTQ